MHMGENEFKEFLCASTGQVQISEYVNSDKKSVLNAVVTASWGTKFLPAPLLKSCFFLMVALRFDEPMFLTIRGKQKIYINHCNLPTLFALLKMSSPE